MLNKSLTFRVSSEGRRLDQPARPGLRCGIRGRSTMKICIYGAGAIGGHLAARLHRAGAEVSVVARGAHLAAIQANGLTVHAVDGEHHAKVRASSEPSELGRQDAVFVTVKAPALPAVAGSIGPLLGADTPVAFV